MALARSSSNTCVRSCSSSVWSEASEEVNCSCIRLVALFDCCSTVSRRWRKRSLEMLCVMSTPMRRTVAPESATVMRTVRNWRDTAQIRTRRRGHDLQSTSHAGRGRMG
jgi:hypothetical protein